MVIRIPVNLDVTDNDIAESIEDEVEQGSRRSRASSAGNIIGRALRAGIGDGIGSGIGDSITRSVQPGITSFGQLSFSLAQVAAGATTAVSAITPLGGALAGVVAGAVAVAGAVGQAAGAAVSLGGVLASLGLGAGVTAIASRGLSDALGAQSKAQAELAASGEVSEATQQALKAAMDALAPSAREVVAEVQALAPAWSAMQNAVQGRFFEGLAASMRTVSDAVLPTLTAGFEETAVVLNAAIRRFADFAGSADFVERVNGTLGSLNGILGALLPGIGQIADALFFVFQDGLLEAGNMAQAFTDLATRFNTFIRAATDSGQLVQFFAQANAVLGDLLGIVGNVGSILVSVFGAGAGVGGELLSILRDATGQLAAFLQTASAQAGLQEFFGLVSQTGDTIAGLGAVIGPIFTGVFAVLGELIPHINALRDALLPVAIIIGENLGVALVGLAPLLGVVAGLIVELVKALAPLISSLASELGPAIAEIGALLAEHLGPAIAELVPLLAPVVAYFTGVFAAQIGNALRFVITIVGSVLQVISGLGDFIIGVFSGDWSRAWNGIKNVFAGVVNIVVGLFRFLYDTIINQMTGGNSRLLGLVGLVNDRMKALFLDGVNNVVAFFGSLPGRVAGAVGDLGSLLYNAGRNVIQGLINGIQAMIGRLASSMRSVASTIRSYLPFSPAKVGPLSGSGNPEESGQTIVDMLASGISSRSSLPARAMSDLLAPLTPSAAQSALPAGTPAAGGATAASAAVEINQNFYGPTTSGGRLQEINWTARYATQARTETVGGVAT